ncbi:hypothetical protein [Streptomyces sp. NPDC059552]|uniref:hypothetical protein n=1 Tax=Streptomyces sp. NPDC059552 TaxID=3346862 RepID=UPI0036A2DBC5
MAPEELSQPSLGRRLKDHIGWWLAALGSLAGIVALLIVIFWPDIGKKDPSMAEWRVKATSVCETFGVPAVTAWSDADRALKKISDKSKGSVDFDKPVDPKATESMGRLYEAAGKAVFYWMGLLRAIEQPPEQAKRINEVLDSGTEIAEAMTLAGRAVVDVDKQTANREFTYLGDNRAQWVKRMAELKAPRCLTEGQHSSDTSTAPKP